jgi:hypothetical protein
LPKPSIGKNIPENRAITLTKRDKAIFVNCSLLTSTHTAPPKVVVKSSKAQKSIKTYKMLLLPKLTIFNLLKIIISKVNMVPMNKKEVKSFEE